MADGGHGVLVVAQGDHSGGHCGDIMIIRRVEARAVSESGRRARGASVRSIGQ